MDLAAYNNSHFKATLDLTNWAAVYVLSTAAFRMQMRPTAESEVVLFTWATSGEVGTITYDSGPKTVTVQASSDDVAPFLGDYVWDIGFTPSGGDFVRITGGALTFSQGVTRD